VASALPPGEICHGRVVVTRHNDGLRVELEGRKGLIKDRSGIYGGELRGGKPHGWGRKIFGSGSVYEGEWENGERRGYGEFSNSSLTQKGLFENGQCIRKINSEKTSTGLLPGLRAPHSEKIKLI
jgi:hypothetical protein